MKNKAKYRLFQPLLRIQVRAKMSYVFQSKAPVSQHTDELNSEEKTVQ